MTFRRRDEPRRIAAQAPDLYSSPLALGEVLNLRHAPSLVSQSRMPLTRPDSGPPGATRRSGRIVTWDWQALRIGSRCPHEDRSPSLV